MLRHLFVLFFLLNTTHLWVLNVNKNTVVQQLTANVTFYCHSDTSDMNEPKITVLNRIRITKFTDKDKWVPVVILTERDPKLKTFLTGAKASGKIDNVANSFIKLHFDVATNDAVGQFLCDVDGYDADSNVKSVRSKPVQVTKQNTLSEISVLQILQDLRNEKDIIETMRKEIKSLESRSKTIDDMRDLVNKVSNGRESTESSVKNSKRIDDIETKMDGMRKIKNKIDEITNSYQKEEHEIKELKNDMKPMKSKLGTITKLSGEIERIKNDRKLSNRKADSVKKRLDSLESKLELINTIKDNLDKTNNDHKQAEKRMKKTMDGLTIKINNLSSKYASLSKQIAMLSTEQRQTKALSKSVNDLKGKLDQLSRGFISLQKKEKKLGTTVSNFLTESSKFGPLTKQQICERWPDDCLEQPFAMA